jgi:glycine hydroxymethyltransferase
MSNQYLGRLDKVVTQHEEWRLKDCLNLIPAENRGSPQMRSMLASDFGNRYTAPDRFYRGTRYSDELLSLTEELARKVFNARYADVRPLSGHIANMAVLLTLTRKGDKILSVSPDEGGYPGIARPGLAELLELENLFFPYNHAAVNIDAKEATYLVKSADPKLILFGASHIVFPQPVKEVGRDASGTVALDGSHVLGLIAGGEFQDPLREGCSLLYGSTHKSLPGPQGGIILSNNEEVFQAVSGPLFPGIVDNIHLNRVAGLAVALLEMIQFGKAYAQAVVKNSQALAKALDAEGIKVRGAAIGYTKSHQVLLDYDATKLESNAGRLEQANIIADNGGRLGTSEITRMGFGTADMETVAELIAMVVLGRKPIEFVQKKVKSMVRQFQQPKFVLQSVPKLLE